MHAAPSRPGRARRRIPPPGLLLAACALLGTLVACGEPGTGDARQATEGDAAAPDPHATDPGAGPQRGFEEAWWKRRVPVSLLVTGGHLGRLQPCGCTDPKTGGLRRAACLLELLHKRAEAARGHVGAVALGWSMRGNHEPQESAKADYLRAVYEGLGFLGVLLGATDLSVPAMCQRRGPEGADAPNVPLNVKLAETNPAAMDATPFLDAEVGDVALRALSVVDPEAAKEMKDAGQVAGTMSVTQAFAGLRPLPGRLWLVGAAPRDAASLAQMRDALRRMGPCIIVDVGGRGLGRGRVDGHRLVAGGEPLVLDLARWGQAVGVIDLVPLEGDGVGAGWSVSYRHIALEPPWEKYGGALMRRVASLESIYRDMVRDDGYLAAFPRGEDGPASFVGSSACARCHAAIYNDWKRSSHASALETLQARGDHRDPDCIRCHVVGWRRMARDDWFVSRSAFRNADDTAYLGGVGCENCHGPGSSHVQDPWDRDLFGPAGPNRARPGRDETCVDCHDAENSHAFGETYDEKALPLVDHRAVPRDRRTVLPPGTPGAPK